MSTSAKAPEPFQPWPARRTSGRTRWCESFGPSAAAGPRSLLQHRIKVRAHTGAGPVRPFGDLLYHLPGGIDDVGLGIHEGPEVAMNQGLAHGEEARLVLLEERA